MQKYFLLLLIILTAGCNRSADKRFSEEDREKIHYLDTLEAQIELALTIASEYNPERIKAILHELDPYYTHFKSSNRQYSREFFIYTLSGLEDTRRSLSKSLAEHQKILNELEYNRNQIKALRRMIAESDSLNDTLKAYIDHEVIAFQETMTKFYKRIRNPLTYKDKWPALKASLDSAMQYDLQLTQQ